MSLIALQPTSILYEEWASVLSSIQNVLDSANLALSRIIALQANALYSANVGAAESTRLTNAVTYFNNMINNAP